MTNWNYSYDRRNDGKFEKYRDKADRRSKILNTRVTDFQGRQIKEYSSELGLTVSDYLRSLAEADLIRAKRAVEPPLPPLGPDEIGLPYKRRR